MTSFAPPSLDQVCARALSLPCSPALLPRLIAAILDPAATADDIADLIKVDSALAVSTLRLANSAFFTGGGKVESVAEAVLRLGHRELYRLSALALVGRWESGAGRGEPGDFCRHALCTALAAEALAESTEQVEPQTAYTAGLVCDLGRLAIAHACAPLFPAIRLHCESRGGSWRQAEQEVLGYTHADVSARLLREWNFPPVLVTAAEFGEKPEAAPEDEKTLLAHLHAAKYIATSFGPGVAEENFLFELNWSFLVSRGFTAELLQETMTIVHERAKARLKDKLTHGAIGL